MAIEEEVVEPQSTEGVQTVEEAPAIEGQQEEQEQGPIPFKVHKTALDNARSKAAEEATAPYAYLQGRDPNDVYQALQNQDHQRNNPEEYADNMRRLYGVTPTQPTQGDNGYPKGHLDQYTGQYFYSQADLQNIRELDKKTIRDEFQKELAPLKQFQEQQSKVQQEQTKANQDIEQWAQTLPAFDELLEGIMKRMKADGRLSVPGAWRKEYDENYLPKLKQQDRNTTMGALKKKAQAGSESRPSKSTGESGGKKPFKTGVKGWDAAFAEAEAELASR